MQHNRNFILLAAITGMCLTTSAALAEADGYLSIWRTSATIAGKGDTKTLALDIQTAKPVPQDGKSGAFGYAALTDNTNNVLVLVTHLPIDDSSHEGSESGFHTHVLDLKPASDACTGASFEVDLENSGKNAAFDADYRWRIKGSRITVDKIPVKDLGDAGVEAIVTFTLQPVLDAEQKPAHLCVTVADQS